MSYAPPPPALGISQPAVSVFEGAFLAAVNGSELAKDFQTRITEINPRYGSSGGLKALLFGITLTPRSLSSNARAPVTMSTAHTVFQSPDQHVRLISVFRSATKGVRADHTSAVMLNAIIDALMRCDDGEDAAQGTRSLCVAVPIASLRGTEEFFMTQEQATLAKQRADWRGTDWVAIEARKNSDRVHHVNDIASALHHTFGPQLPSEHSFVMTRITQLEDNIDVYVEERTGDGLDTVTVAEGAATFSRISPSKLRRAAEFISGVRGSAAERDLFNTQWRPSLQTHLESVLADDRSDRSTNPEAPEERGFLVKIPC